MANSRKVTFHAPSGYRVSLGDSGSLDFGANGELSLDADDPWVDALERNFCEPDVYPVTSQPAASKPAPSKSKETS